MYVRMYSYVMAPHTLLLLCVICGRLLVLEQIRERERLVSRL